MYLVGHAVAIIKYSVMEMMTMVSPGNGQFLRYRNFSINWWRRVVVMIHQSIRSRKCWESFCVSVGKLSLGQCFVLPFCLTYFGASFQTSPTWRWKARISSIWSRTGLDPLKKGAHPHAPQTNQLRLKTLPRTRRTKRKILKYFGARRSKSKGVSFVFFSETRDIWQETFAWQRA